MNALHLTAFTCVLLTTTACQSRPDQHDINWPQMVAEPQINASLSQQRHKVYFETDMHDIPDSEMASLAAFARSINHSALVRIKMNGHADNRGTARYNDALSLQRAQEIEHALRKMGLTKIRLEAQGFGENSPVAFGQSAESLALNRRVEIVAETVALDIEGCNNNDFTLSQNVSNQRDHTLGCANIANLAVSVANPADLLPPDLGVNSQISPADGSSQFGAIDRYRKNEVTPLPDTGSF